MTEPTTSPVGGAHAELDQGGELLEFRAPRDDRQAAEAVARNDDDRVPVYPPEVPLSTLGPVWERPTDRRPVLRPG